MKRYFLWLAVGLAVGVLLSPVVTSQCRPSIDSLTGHAIELCEGQTKPFCCLFLTGELSRHQRCV
jgi:hypothetical protein